MNGLSPSLHLAVDGGGTRSRLALSDGLTVHVVEGGPANVSSDFDDAIERLRTGLDQLAEVAGLMPEALAQIPAYLGLAGVTGPEMAARVAAALPLTHAIVEEDRMAALEGALGPGPGAIAHCGTGSFLGLRADGAVRFTGGLGPVLGDEASAHWVGRHALARCAEADSPFARAMQDRFDGVAGIIAFAGGADQAAMGALAPEVTHAAATGDAVASSVMQDGADYIAQELTRMGWTPKMSLCLTGGIGPEFAPWLPKQMQTALMPPRDEPLAGALALARRFAALPPARAGGAVQIFAGGPVFDGERLWDAHAARFVGGELEAILPAAHLEPGAPVTPLNGDILSAGFVDLQANGGGGVMLGNADAAGFARILQAHRRLGTVAMLPTLITDTPEVTRAVIATAIASSDHGLAGLHLEGPHLAQARKGAHDAALIRPMTEPDLQALVAAAKALPALMVTLAPENVTQDQVQRLAAAGVIVSLGHTDADFDTCMAYIDAGASVFTHLFNAMRPLGHRAPGAVGAALSHGGASAGLIADGVHVHPAAMRAAHTAKSRPGELFLVTDAMAVAGTTDTSFTLGGRQITRKGGSLRLADGTLAGADLTMPRAVEQYCAACGLSLECGLQAAITVPSLLIGRAPRRRQIADFIRIEADLSSAAPVLPDV